MQTYHRLDDVHMSEIDREHAKAHMRSAELTIDFVFERNESSPNQLGARAICNQPSAVDPNLPSSVGAVSARLEQHFNSRTDLGVREDVVHPRSMKAADNVGSRIVSATTVLGMSICRGVCPTYPINPLAGAHMPLPPSLDRELLHVRNFDLRGFRGSDGAFEIEGRVTAKLITSNTISANDRRTCQVRTITAASGSALRRMMSKRCRLRYQAVTC